jgi:uncharacterized membrane protein YccC
MPLKLPARFRPRMAQVRLGLRVTIAVLTAFVVGRLLDVPLAGLWAVLTALIVTQMSVGGSLKATIEYLVGTLGGAVYAGAVAALIPHENELALLAVLAFALGPMALLAAMDPSFRAAPFTAAVVVLGATTTHTGPIGAATYRVLEVALGAAAGIIVSLLVLPARAHVLVAGAAARTLELIAQALPDLLAGFLRPLDPARMSTLHADIFAAFAQVDTRAGEARREQMTYLAAEPDPGPLLRTLLRLRHDLVMVGRPAATPLPEQLQARLGPLLTRFGEAGSEYLRASATALKAGGEAPPLAAVEAAVEGFAAEVAVLRREGVLRELPTEDVERFYTLSFALEQLRRNFDDLARCLTEFAQPASAPLVKAEPEADRPRP